MTLRTENFFAVRLLRQETLDDITVNDIAASYKVFVNGAWVGVHREPHRLWRTATQELRHGSAFSAENPFETSIVRDIRQRELRINMDAGRTCRPLFVVDDNNRLKMRESHLNDQTWSEYVANGLVEYLDTEEEETAMIAMLLQDLSGRYCTTYTHCEIHPSMILGICASIIPFPDHNQVRFFCVCPCGRSPSELTVVSTQISIGL